MLLLSDAKPELGTCRIWRLYAFTLRGRFDEGGIYELELISGKHDTNKWQGVSEICREIMRGLVFGD